MRYLNGYKIFEDRNDTESICDKYEITNYTIRTDGLIDVDHDVDLYNIGLYEIPLKFGHVTGIFDCSKNKLISLSGCPDKIDNHFYCEENELTTLEGGPTNVGGYYQCHYNRLTSLLGSPDKVGRGFYCSHNKLYSLEYFPRELNGVFDCSSNPIYPIVNKFVGGGSNARYIAMELFNDTDIVQERNVIYDRLVWFYEEIGIDFNQHTISEIEKYYTIKR